jgi:hypothetical protein
MNGLAGIVSEAEEVKRINSLKRLVFTTDHMKCGITHQGFNTGIAIKGSHVTSIEPIEFGNLSQTISGMEHLM